MNPTNSVFDRIEQLAIVVRNLRKTSDYYGALGIGPFGPPRQAITRYEYQDKPVDTEVKVLLSSIGDIGIELIQPIRGKSLSQALLDGKGEGLYYLTSFVRNIDNAEEDLVRQGVKIIQKGRSDRGGYTSFDTASVGGVFFDLIQKPEGIEIIKTSSHGHPFTVLNHVALVVSDIDRALKHYSKLGIGPFKPSPLEFAETWFRGKEVDCKFKTMVVQLGPLEIELIQPIGPSIFLEFLERKGEGVHHLGFLVDDLDGEEEKLVGKGIRVLQKARGLSFGYTLLETDHIGGVVFEIFKKP